MTIESFKWRVTGMAVPSSSLPEKNVVGDFLFSITQSGFRSRDEGQRRVLAKERVQVPSSTQEIPAPPRVSEDLIPTHGAHQEVAARKEAVHAAHFQHQPEAGRTPDRVEHR